MNMSNILGGFSFLRVLLGFIRETRLLSLLIMCFCLLGCAQHTRELQTRRPDIDAFSDSFWDSSIFPIILDVDPDLGQGICDNIRLAANQWNLAIGSEVFHIREYDIEQAISYGVLTDPPIGHVFMYATELGMSNEENHILGLARRDIINGEIISGVVFVDEELTVYNSYVVMLHELGHILGLRHSPKDSDSIMYPYPLNGTGLIREGDLEWIRQQITSQSSP